MKAIVYVNREQPAFDGLLVSSNVALSVKLGGNVRDVVQEFEQCGGTISSIFHILDVFHKILLF